VKLLTDKQTERKITPDKSTFLAEVIILTEMQTDDSSSRFQVLYEIISNVYSNKHKEENTY